MISYTDDEIEEERNEAIFELTNRFDETLDEIRERYVNEIGHHEVLHTASIFMDNVASYLLEHPAVIFDPTAYRIAFDAHTAIFNLYQHMGLHKVEDNKPAEPTLAPDWEDKNMTAREKPWLYVLMHLDAFFDLSKKHEIALRKSLNAMKDAFLEDDSDEDDVVPNLGSFHVLLHMLVDHPELPSPAIGVNADGNFCAIWDKDNKRWSLAFRPWEIQHNNPTQESVRPQKNINCKLYDPENKPLVSSTILVGIDEIKIPDWLKGISQ